MNSLLSIIKKFHTADVLVIGDVMLDIYVHGSIERISPEAPIPILKIENKTEMLGGAGNVISNLNSLGVKSALISVVGQDENGTKINSILSGIENVSHYLLISAEMPTITKTRFVCGNQQILRTDVEAPDLIPANLENIFLEKVIEYIQTCDIIVLSDYRKGVLSPQVCSTIISIARKNKIPVFIDPKAMDYSIYRGATLIKPNHKELKNAFPNKDILGNEVFYARLLLQQYDIEYCLLTLGKDGMLLISQEQAQTFGSVKKEVFDVSGAGDTVIATLAACHAVGAKIEDCCLLSNIAGGIVVEKSGTSPVMSWEIENEIESKNKIFNFSQLMLQVEVWRKCGYSIGFTNGCFDLLHAGHIQTLTFGRKHCDKLIVGLNSDNSVKKLKGALRPINGQDQRSLIMSELESINAIIVFEDETPEKLITSIKPDVLVKGADYKSVEVVGKDFVESYGGKVLLAPFLKDFSTTNLIANMQQISVRTIIEDQAYNIANA